MKINWKLRLKNPWFYVALFATVAGSIGTNLGIGAEDMDTWAKVGEAVLATIKTPYMLVSVITTTFAFLIDPTTKGISDSKQALEYEKPKE